jgi:hypothetical protein
MKRSPPSGSSEYEARVAQAQAESARAEADRTAAEASRAQADAAKAQADAARAQAEADKAKAQADKVKEQRKAKGDEERRKAEKAAVGAFSKLPLPGKIAVFAVPIAIVVVIAGVVLPMSTSKTETKYLSESELKAAVNIESLSTVDYAYTGIAEKAGKFLWMDNISYRVKYQAYVSADCNMGEIEFKIDQDNMVVTAYLPEATVEEPVLDRNSFDYLPGEPDANISEVIELCKADAANDVDTEEIKARAKENLQSTVKALTMPLLSTDGWKLKFAGLADYQQADAATEAEGESADDASTDDGEQTDGNAETEASNEG